MNEDRKLTLAQRIGKTPGQVPAVILKLLEATSQDSPVQKMMLADIAKTINSPPSPEAFEEYFVLLAKGMQYVHEQFPDKIIGNLQFVGQMLDENHRPLPPKLAYLPENDTLYISPQMAALHNTAKSWDQTFSMPYMPHVALNVDEIAFLSGVEEAYHAVQHKVPEIYQRLIGEGNGIKDNENFEKDAGVYRQQVATALNIGQASNRIIR